MGKFTSFGALATALLLSACVGTTPTLTNADATSTLTSAISTPTFAPSSTPTRVIPKSDQIWFAPLMFGMPGPAAQHGYGAHDYIDLFKKDAPWQNASKRLHVFKFYIDSFSVWDDATLREIMDDLNRRGIAIAIEAPPLTWTKTCGQGIEGFANNASARTLQIAQRIQAAGGTLRFVALDEPFLFGSYLSRPEGCGLTVEEVARQVADYIAAVKRSFPDIVIGDIEGDHASVEGVERFLEAYRNVTGEYLPFIHWDVDWQARPDWPERAKALETHARARGIAFGMIYFGNFDDRTDGEWLKNAEDHMAVYETIGNGKPDHVIFQSWHDHPHYLLPETDPTKFTHLINRYFDKRTVLDLSLSPPSSDQSRQVVGKLTDSTGVPIGGARIGLTVKPIDGRGQFAEYTLSDIVPGGTKQAVVGFRINTECNCDGTSEFALYEVSYREGSDNSQRVPNGDFSQGLQNWGFLTPETVQLQRSDRGSGQMQHVIATATQKAAINSANFPVTSGAIYTATFAARVAPSSVGSGYFAVIFIAEREITRKTILLEPANRTFQVATDTTGNFHLKLSDFPPDRLTLQGKYAGDDDHWPVYSRSTP